MRVCKIKEQRKFSRTVLVWGIHKTRRSIVLESNVIFRNGHLSGVPLDLHSHLPLVPIFLAHRNKHCYTTSICVCMCTYICVCTSTVRIHESPLHQIRKRVWNRGIRYVKLFRGVQATARSRKRSFRRRANPAKLVQL